MQQDLGLLTDIVQYPRQVLVIELSLEEKNPGKS